jgi:hypothetical protein
MTSPFRTGGGNGAGKQEMQDHRKRAEYRKHIEGEHQMDNA